MVTLDQGCTPVGEKLASLGCGGSPIPATLNMVGMDKTTTKGPLLLRVNIPFLYPNSFPPGL
jgi:hypothetical protein